MVNESREVSEHETIHRRPISSWSQEWISRDHHEVIWMEYAEFLNPTLQRGFMG
jgi:hypothetical protein